MELKDQKHMISRLKRIEGQVRGLQKMIESNKPCTEIIVQVSAVKSALEMVSRKLFEDYTSTCLLEFQKMVSVSEKPDAEQMKEMQKKLTVLSEFLGQLLMTERRFIEKEPLKGGESLLGDHSSEGETK